MIFLQDLVGIVNTSAHEWRCTFNYLRNFFVCILHLNFD
jgi:hypothetical protein